MQSSVRLSISTPSTKLNTADSEAADVAESLPNLSGAQVPIDRRCVSYGVRMALVINPAAARCVGRKR